MEGDDHRTQRWERRADKRDARRRRMRVNGRGVITVLSALESKRERARRAQEAKNNG